MSANGLPLRERPEYRVRYEPRACSTAELVAAVLGGNDAVEHAHALLQQAGGLFKLARLNFEELTRIPGLGPGKATRLRASFELGLRSLDLEPDKAFVNGPAAVAQLMMPEVGFEEVENMWVLLLDARSRVKRIVKLYQGNVNTSIIRAAEVFRDAVRMNIPHLVLVHNHPSGDPTPSPEDVAVTRTIVEAGRLLDIEVLDHMVLTSDATRYTSLRAKGLGF